MSAGADVFIADDFAGAVLYVVSRIPPGRVMTYGGIAAVLGTRAARAVGTVMARSGADSPWWRVVRSDGRAPQGFEAEALEHYRAEGTPLIESSTGYRVVLREARWRG